MVDLKTKYLGLELANPLVPSASPLCESVDNVKKMEDCGAAAVVLHSLFEEQLRQESLGFHQDLTYGSESFAEALDYFPDLTDLKVGPEEYLKHISDCKAATDIPIIGSLNGSTHGGWVRFAREMESAGADAVELNVYHIPTSIYESGPKVEDRYIELVREVKAGLNVPLAVKIGPYFSALGGMCDKLVEAGADGLVLFNRFYQPDFDLEELEVTTNLNLSNSAELRLRLRWVAILYGRVRADLALTGGVHTVDDVIKSVMAGANIAMTTSALLRHGVERLKQLREGLVAWLEEHEYESIEQMRGSMSQQAVADPTAFERANYLKVLTSYEPDRKY